MLPAPQFTHAAPPAPHSVGDCAPGFTQVEPLQQPFGQDVGLHTQAPVAVSHACPAAHATHAAPATPHALFVCDPGTTHAPLAVQHPPSHELALHTHRPLLVSHSWPEAHAAQSVPEAPHDAVDSLASGSHVAPDVQQPAHAEPPQVHAPPEQLPPAAHGAHVAPALPHDAADCASHVSHWPLAVQHPPAHVVGPQGGADSAASSPCASSPCATSAVASPASPPEVASAPELLPEDEPVASAPPSLVVAGP